MWECGENQVCSVKGGTRTMYILLIQLVINRTMKYKAGCFTPVMRYPRTYEPFSGDSDIHV